MSSQRTKVSINNPITGDVSVDFVPVAGYDPFAADEITNKKPSALTSYEIKQATLDVLKDKIRFWVSRGIHSPATIIAKVYNPDQAEVLDKDDILKAFRDVMRELVADVQQRDIRQYFLTRMFEFDALQEECYKVIDSPHARVGDKIAAVNTIDRLSASRLQHLEKMGVKVNLYTDENNLNTPAIVGSSPISVDEKAVTKMDEIKALNARADEIEVEFKNAS